MIGGGRKPRCFRCWQILPNTRHKCITETKSGATTTPFALHSAACFAWLIKLSLPKAPSGSRAYLFAEGQAEGAASVLHFFREFDLHHLLGITFRGEWQFFLAGPVGHPDSHF